jgi:hypothetical protein
LRLDGVAAGIFGVIAILIASDLMRDGILVAARDRTDARHHYFEHRVPDPARIAAIRPPVSCTVVASVLAPSRLFTVAM